MQIGGIERVCLDYIKIFIKLGYSVTLFNLRPKLSDLEKEIPSQVSIINVPFARRFSPEQYTQLIKKNLFYKLCFPLIYFILLCLNYIYKLYCKLVYKACRTQFDISVAFSSHFNDLTFVAEHYVKSSYTMAWCHGALYGYLLISDGFINLYNRIKNIVVLVDDAQREVEITNKQLHLKIFKLYNPSFIKKREVDKNKVSELRKKYGRFLLMVSRFEYPHKDHFTVLKAFNMLRTLYKRKLDLVLVGDGPSLNDVKKLASSFSSSVSKHIHFMGPRFDVQNYYAAAYLLVHASVAGEGLPTVMIEAMNYGLPEVVTDSKVGPREILGNNEYGLLSKVENPTDFAVQINKLLGNPNLYKFYQHNESERVKDFKPNNIKKQLQKILEKIQNE